MFEAASRVVQHETSYPIASSIYIKIWILNDVCFFSKRWGSQSLLSCLSLKTYWLPTTPQHKNYSGIFFLISATAIRYIRTTAAGWLQARGLKKPKGAHQSFCSTKKKRHTIQQISQLMIGLNHSTKKMFYLYYQQLRNCKLLTKTFAAWCMSSSS